MFWKYMLKRVFYGIFIYIILIFVFSALSTPSWNRPCEDRSMRKLEES